MDKVPYYHIATGPTHVSSFAFTSPLFVHPLIQYDGAWRIVPIESSIFMIEKIDCQFMRFRPVLKSWPPVHRSNIDLLCNSKCCAQKMNKLKDKLPKVSLWTAAKATPYLSLQPHPQHAFTCQAGNTRDRGGISALIYAAKYWKNLYNLGSWTGCN